MDDNYTQSNPVLPIDSPVNAADAATDGMVVEVVAENAVDAANPETNVEDAPINAAEAATDAMAVEIAAENAVTSEAIAAAGESAKTRARADARVIRLRAEKNPKREGTLAHSRFAIYREGMAVSEYVAAGGRRSDLAYDVNHGNIELVTS